MLTHKKLKEAAGTQAFILAWQKEIKNQEENCTNKRKAAKIITGYKQEITRLQNQRNEVLQEVTQLSNIRIKTAIIMHYFNGLAWRDIAQKIGMGDSEESIRKAVKRFFDEQEAKGNEKSL